MKFARMMALVLVLSATISFAGSGCSKSEEGKPKAGNTPEEQQARKDKKGEE